MDFNLSEEQKMIQQVAREFAQREIEPIAAQIDEESRIPADMAQKLGKGNFLGMLCPNKYGGAETGFLNYVMAYEQLNYPVSGCCAIVRNNNLCCEVIAMFGTEEQKEVYLEPLCEGKAIASNGFTEPESGTDPKSLVTKAELIGDCWIINGVKRFNTLGECDGPNTIYANVDRNKLTVFIVDKNTEGYTTSAPFRLMGLRGATTGDTYLDNLRIPRGNLLGEIGQGIAILLRVLPSERVTSAIESVAWAQAALDEAIGYSKNRIHRGVPIASMQTIRWLLAEMTCRVNAARWLTYRAGFLVEHGQDAFHEAEIAKLFAAKAGVEVASMAMQVHGAYGFIRDYKVERIYRTAKFSEVVAVSSEVHRMNIGRYLVKDN